MAITRQLLSGSTNGRPIKVAATSTPGTTIHTADASAKDEVYLYATNTDGSDRALTLELGGTTSPDDLMKFGIPAGETIFLGAFTLTGSVVTRAFGASGNVINIAGHVNRIS